MPRYHFPIVNGHRLEDPVGVELADSAAAKMHANTIAKYVADAGSKKPRKVLAEDESGAQVGTVVVHHSDKESD